MQAIFLVQIAAYCLCYKQSSLAYFCRFRRRVGMFLYGREVGEELGQKFGDFSSDCSGSVLKFRGCNPAGNNIVGIDLETEKRAEPKC